MLFVASWWSLASYLFDIFVVNLQVGPYYVSGGDRQNPCSYTFLWETVGACPIQSIRSDTCRLKLSSGFTFDLSLLQHPFNTTAATTNTTTSQNSTYHISSDSFSFDLAICGSLPTPCNNKSGVPVCQTEIANQKQHACGTNESLELVHFDGSLSLTYEDGDLCHHNQRSRRVRVNFECDRTANLSTFPHYIRETDCQYSFEWATPLACPPRELACVAAGGKYDLTPLLGNKFWYVDTGGSELGEYYVYVIGGCR